MLEAFQLIGIVFVVLGVVMLPMAWGQRGTSTSWEILGGYAAVVWILIAFGLGSYVVSVIFYASLYAIDKTVGLLTFFAVLIVAIFLLGAFSRSGVARRLWRK